MTDDQIHACIDRKNEVVIDAVKTLFDAHTSSISTLLTSETEGIKEHIKRLETQVIKQNGSVRDLKEWKARHDGIEEANENHKKRNLSSWQVAGIVIAALIGLSTVTLSIINTVKSHNRDVQAQKVENWMELWDFSPITRGGQPILDTSKFKIKSDAEGQSSIQGM